ncbi:MAG: two-component regulator propeller domain-containing protein [Flavobacteriales bacterium]
MTTKKFLLFLFVFSTISSSLSQGTAIGQWKSYFPYKSVIDIAKNGNIVYGATRNAVIIKDYGDNSVERLTKVNALSDNGLSSIEYSPNTKFLVVGYDNGNVDLIKENVTTNLFQIKESSIIGDKKIYDIFCKDNLAYLSCGFGIVVFDLTKKEVKDTYIIGPGGSQLRINVTFVSDGVIYAGAENGLFTANESSTFLTDFNSWTKSTSIPNPNSEIKDISVLNSKVIFSSSNSSSSDSLFVKNGTNWTRITSIPSKANRSIFAGNSRLVVSQFDTLYVCDTNFALIETLSDYSGYWKPRSHCAIYDGSNYYIGDDGNAIVKMKTNFDAVWDQPNFLYSNNVLDIEVEDGQLWGSTGSLVGGGWNKTYNNDGAFHYNIDENSWTIYNNGAQSGDFCFSNGCMNDFVGMAVDPKNAEVGYVFSFSAKGVAQLSKNKVIAAFDSSNSPIKISNSHNDRFAVKDGTFDEDGNLWIVNSWVEKPLIVKTASGSWKSFSCGPANQNFLIASIMIDEENGFKWMIYKDNKIVVYNDNGTISDTTDDSYRVLSNGVANGGLDAIPVSMAEDRDGEIWIGTNEGIYVLFNPSEVFSSSAQVQKIKVTFGGNVELLLENENVTAIAIDGGNRKWIGTEGSGIFVLAPDGTSQELRFNEDNSPLLSNKINDIAIDHRTGEVFISTDKGLISYKGEATAPQDAFVDVYAYPNPVKPGYAGKIAIKGLVADSDVRITDVSGNVVFNTVSIGGQAIWDGNKLDGTRASSGIYLVFMASPEGTSKQVTKILFMN